MLRLSKNNNYEYQAIHQAGKERAGNKPSQRVEENIVSWFAKRSQS